MNPIRKMSITGMTISGFKCFAEQTELPFGNPTVITGGNGRGKSSVADAIAFAVTGLPFFGERGIDRLHAEQEEKLFISLRFLDENDLEHELTRSRQKSRMTITLDGREVRQSDLTELFGEKDVFLSILNPLYFIEELGEDGKKLLERYLPEIPQEAVLAQLSNSVRETFAAEKILSPESYLKMKREEIRELEKTVIYLTGQKDLAAMQRREAESEGDVLRTKQRALEAEYAELDARRSTGADAGDTQDKLVELSARYEDLARETIEPPDTKELDEKLLALQRKRGERGAERYAPKYAEKIAEYRAKLQELGERYKKEAAAYKSLKAGVACPTCRRIMTEEALPAVRQDFQKSLSEIVLLGKQGKAQLDELYALEKQTEETFLKFQQEDLQRLEEKTQRLSDEREALFSRGQEAGETRQREMDSLLAQIRSLSAEAECGALTPEEHDRFLACKQELEECRDAVARMDSYARADTEDYDEKIRDAERGIDERKKRIADVALYVSKRAELLFSSLKMNRVQISLFDVVKSTGEVKDAFKFTYNGRRYDRLSLSEKIRAGMEVSELVKRLTGRNYPQYVDNMESVDDLANVRPSGQVIMAKCLRGTALSVRALGQEQSLPQAA